MTTGIVTVVFERENYGFIATEATEASPVFLLEDLEDTPQEGDRIEFVIEERADWLRPKATELTRVEQ
ncbi:MAG: hypothetical protein ABEI76_08375 [Halobacteriales archaeon]